MIRLITTGFAAIIILLATVNSHAGNSTSDKDIIGSNERDVEQRIKDSYLSLDFSTTVKLLEIQTYRMSKKVSKGEKVNAPEFFKKQLLLAYLYAWKLDKADRALVEYQKLADFLASSTEHNKFPPIEYLYMGEIYEIRKDFPKALEYYQKCLDAFQSLQEKGHDDFSIMIGDHLIKLIKYRIDGVNLKAKKEFKPLLEKLKPVTNPAYLSVLQMLSLVLVPTAEYEINIAMKKTDLPTYIKQSPSNLASETMNFMLALGASSSTIDESSEKAMNTYLSKYPDSYYSLILGSAFYKHYKENGIIEKEKALLKELQEIAKKRRMELVLGPDSRFSSPEKTFEIYKKALIAGNIEAVEECYVSEQSHKVRQMFRAIAKEKAKEIGTGFDSLQKITSNGKMATYKTLLKMNGQDIIRHINFRNIDGEWKMEEF